ncbi:hypothetical protein PFISCL1PPCAC_16834, partial [Pristionchus fissidentatus]
LFKIVCLSTIPNNSSNVYIIRVLTMKFLLIFLLVAIIAASIYAESAAGSGVTAHGKDDAAHAATARGTRDAGVDF